MRKEVGYEVYCRECGATHDFTHEVYRCESCLSPDIHNNPYITCDCGTRVYLDVDTNECVGCGQKYSKIGEQT